MSTKEKKKVKVYEGEQLELARKACGIESLEIDAVIAPADESLPDAAALKRDYDKITFSPEYVERLEGVARRIGVSVPELLAMGLEAYQNGTGLRRLNE